MRPIDADALRELLKAWKCAAQDLGAEINNMFASAIIAQVDAMPTIEPERKKGKWISQDLNKHSGMISTAVYYYPKCSVCGSNANYTNFCPNCGADMRGKDRDEG